jgi:hypothetical protein
MGDIDPRYVAEAVRYAPEEALPPERSKHMRSKRILSLTLAAALVVALGFTAYGLYLGFEYRRPAAEETFSIHWDDSPDGTITWSDAKLAVTLPELEESQEIEFRTGWLPGDMLSLQSEDWKQYFTAERLCDNGNNVGVPAYRGMMQPLQIQTFCTTQFNQGGAMLLLYQTPGEIREEHWDEKNLDVLLFHSSIHLDAVPEYNVPAREYEFDNILLLNQEEGWVVKLVGQIGEEQLRKVAEHLEIRPTGNILRSEDFRDRFLFFDAGVG